MSDKNTDDFECASLRAPQRLRDREIPEVWYNKMLFGRMR